MLAFGKVQGSCGQSSFLLCRSALCALGGRTYPFATLPAHLPVATEHLYQHPYRVRGGTAGSQTSCNCFSLHFLLVPAPLCCPGHWWGSCQACLAQLPHPGPGQPVPEHGCRQPDEPAAAPWHPGEDQSAHAARGAAHQGGQ